MGNWHADYDQIGHGPLQKRQRMLASIGFGDYSELHATFDEHLRGLSHQPVIVNQQHPVSPVHPWSRRPLRR